jgi:D-glycero-D-manno-heptose 1,7-bisphosphate phosphatase
MTRNDTGQILKLLLLDKDGTLVKPASGQRYVQDFNDQELLPGVAAAIDRYVADGWQPAIVSNQGGVEAGHKTLESTIAEMLFCLEFFNGKVSEAYFCPDFSGLLCWRVSGVQNIAVHEQWPQYEKFAGHYRKPNAGMLMLAIAHNQASYNPIPQVKALMVGDRPEDNAAAIAAGVPFMTAEQWRFT